MVCLCAFYEIKILLISYSNKCFTFLTHTLSEHTESHELTYYDKIQLQLNNVV